MCWHALSCSLVGMTQRLTNSLVYVFYSAPARILAAMMSHLTFSPSHPFKRPTAQSTPSRFLLKHVFRVPHPYHKYTHLHSVSNSMPLQEQGGDTGYMSDGPPPTLALCVAGAPGVPQPHPMLCVGGVTMFVLCVVGSGSLVFQDNQKVVWGAAGALVMRTMEHFPMHSCIQQFGCLVLANLAVNEDRQKAICKAGGVDTITDAMHTHLETEGVQKAACLGLMHLAGHSAAKERILEAGAVPLILKAMRHYPANERILMYGCITVGNLAAVDTPSARDRMKMDMIHGDGAGDGISFITKVLEGQSNKAILVVAARTLVALRELAQ